MSKIPVEFCTPDKKPGSSGRPGYEAQRPGVLCSQAFHHPGLSRDTTSNLIHEADDDALMWLESTASTALAKKNNRLTAAKAAGRFAAKHYAGRRHRTTAEGAVAQQQFG